MCKLCNSDSPPILSSKQPINHVVKDYIGTFPCKSCARTLLESQRTYSDKSLDYLVITKLYWKYRQFTHQQLGAKAHLTKQLSLLLKLN